MDDSRSVCQPKRISSSSFRRRSLAQRTLRRASTVKIWIQSECFSWRFWTVKLKHCSDLL
ncbi:hypothetical protein DNTS_029641 [Danionella cerebrum]|uniref:Uncharacterized protein n=1 Tax=Danionella cerebrum TaxID=2873325 RepID=A0A553QPS1_9TELE|nr:hypothetical protein DNTS_029641 [Danionella translucida]TRY91928.1 hypothetical protein DNTS_029641 [Danionella translucida]